MRRAMTAMGLVALALASLLAAACYDIIVEPAPTPEGDGEASELIAALTALGGGSGISVSGTGSVTVTPDIGVFEVGVEVTADTVALARSAAAEAMQRVRASITGNGVEERDIATRFFNIYPQYDYDNDGGPRITGYTVNNHIEVKVRDIDRLSDILDQAVTAGGDAIRVGGISFRVDEPEQYADEARRLAVEDARSRAQQLADLAGVTLGSARTISESSGGFAQRGFADAPAAFADDASSPVSPGESEVSVTVHIVYAID